MPGYQAFSARKRASLQSDYRVLKERHPEHLEAGTQYRQLFKVYVALRMWLGIQTLLSKRAQNGRQYSTPRKKTGPSSENTLQCTVWYIYALHHTPRNSILKRKVSKRFGGENDTAATRPPNIKETSGDGNVRRNKHQPQGSAHQKLLAPPLEYPAGTPILPARRRVPNSW